MKVKKTRAFSDNRTQKETAWEELQRPPGISVSTELRNNVGARRESRVRPGKKILVNSVTI